MPNARLLTIWVELQHRTVLSSVWSCLTCWVDAPPKKNTKMVFPKSVKFMDSRSEVCERSAQTNGTIRKVSGNGRCNKRGISLLWQHGQRWRCEALSARRLTKQELNSPSRKANSDVSASPACKAQVIPFKLEERQCKSRFLLSSNVQLSVGKQHQFNKAEDLVHSPQRTQC